MLVCAIIGLHADTSSPPTCCTAHVQPLPQLLPNFAPPCLTVVANLSVTLLQGPCDAMCSDTCTRWKQMRLQAACQPFLASKGHPSDALHSTAPAICMQQAPASSRETVHISAGLQQHNKPPCRANTMPRTGPKQTATAGCSERLQHAAPSCQLSEMPSVRCQLSEVPRRGLAPSATLNAVHC